MGRKGAEQWVELRWLIATTAWMEVVRYRLHVLGHQGEPLMSTVKCHTAWGTKGHGVTRSNSPPSEGSVMFRMQFGPEATGPCHRMALWDFGSFGD